MTRYKILIEYDGGPFVGWQRQENGPSVQAALEEAVFRFCGERVDIASAGRTDAGVHALAQVGSFDLAKETTPETLRDAVNFHLKPAPIALLAAEIAAPDFHARFSALWRSYRYRIINRRGPLALERGRAWGMTQELDVAAMDRAAQLLVGRHDFTSFRSSTCQAASPIKTLDLLRVSRAGEEIRIEAQARSFLHHQVRNLVGTLKLVGEGKWREADVAAALAARDRSAAGPTAPAYGLYFMGVGYPETGAAAR